MNYSLSHEIFVSGPYCIGCSPSRGMKIDFRQPQEFKILDCYTKSLFHIETTTRVEYGLNPTCILGALCMRSGFGEFVICFFREASNSSSLVRGYASALCRGGSTRNQNKENYDGRKNSHRPLPLMASGRANVHQVDDESPAYSPELGQLLPRYTGLLYSAGNPTSRES